MPESLQSDLPEPPGTSPTSAMRRFDLATLAAMPWKNGGGTTREIACWPAESDMDTFDWRISVARIDRDGPFSVFPGVDRIITLLDGAGVMLLDEGGTTPATECRSTAPATQPSHISAHTSSHRSAPASSHASTRTSSHALTQPLAPYCFDGEAPIYGKLIAGPSEDLNVMSRRSRIKAKICVVHDAANLPTANAGMLLAVHAPWHIQCANGARHTLAPGEGIWWSQQSHAWTVAPASGAPNADLIAIAFHDTTTQHPSGGPA